MGLELGLIQKQKHTAHHTAPGWEQSLHIDEYLFFWSTHCPGHTVLEDDKKHHNSPPPVCNFAMNPRPEIKQITKRSKQKIHRWSDMGE